jgi:hypothetical protein
MRVRDHILKRIAAQLARCNSALAQTQRVVVNAEADRRATLETSGTSCISTMIAQSPMAVIMVAGRVWRCGVGALGRVSVMTGKTSK